MAESTPPEENKQDNISQPEEQQEPGATADDAKAGGQPEISESPEPAHAVEDKEPAEPKRLYRSRTNRIIGGVAGGIGEYFGIDPVIVRLLFVLFTFAGGAGILAYIAALIVIPESPEGEVSAWVSTQDETRPQGGAQVAPTHVSGEIGLILGLFLVGLGVWFLLSNLNIIPPQFFFIWRFFERAFWPSVLILIGVFIIIAASRAQGRGITISTQGRTLYRSRTNRKLSGVAGGIGEYFGVDPTLVRIAWVVVGIINPPAAIIAYIVAAIVIPEEPR